MSDEREKMKKRKTEKNVQEFIGCETISGPDSINELNDDCLVRIFQSLPILERLVVESVCKRWRKTAKLAWSDTKNLDLVSELPSAHELVQAGLSRAHDQFATRVIKNCGRYLKILKIGYPYSFAILPYFGEHCYNLERFEIGLANYGNNACKIFTNLEKLKYIKISKVNRKFPEEIFDVIPTENLSEIYLSAEDYVPVPGTVPGFCRKIPNLKTLTLKKFGLSTDMMQTIGDQRHLTYLYLDYCGFDPINLREIPKLTSLEYLALPMVVVSQGFLEKLGNNCKRLKFLILEPPHGMSDTGLNFLTKLPELEELVVSSDRITDESLRHFHHVKKLTCRDCSRVKNRGMIELIKYADDLRYLNVADTKVSKNLLTAASEITRKRTNGVELKVVVSSKVLKNWDQKANFSPLLKVRGIKEYEARGRRPDPWR